MAGRAMTAATFACLLLAACGGQTMSYEPGSGGTRAGSGSAGAGAGAVASGIRAPDDGVLVVDENDVPIQGATVVVDRAGSIEEQRTTHPDGVAYFSDLDFASETVDITAFSPGRVLVTVLGVSPTGSRVLHLRPRTSSAQWTRTLKVKIANKVSNSDCIAVGLTTPSVHEATCGESPQPDSVILKTTPGTSGKVIAQEVVSNGSNCPSSIAALFAADIPSSGDNLVVDFAKATPMEVASGTLDVPYAAHGCSVGITSRKVTSDVLAFFSYEPFVDTRWVCHWKTAYVRAFPESEVETEYDSYFGLTRVGVTQHGYFPHTAPPPLPGPIWFTSPPDGGLFEPITWTAGSELPDRLIIWASDPSVTTIFPVWTIWFSPEPDGVTLRKPPDSIWKQLDWRDAPAVFPMLKYCDPGPEQCGGRPCTPTEEPWCKRYVEALTPDERVP